MKRCSKCDQEKDESQFYRQSKDKLRAACKSCTNAQNRQWHINHPEKQVEYNKRFVEKHPEKVRAAAAAWRDRNREYLLEKSRNRKRDPNRIRNREYDREYARKWNAANLEKRRITQSRYRALKRGNSIGVITREDIIKMLAKPCFYCGAKSEHIDHVVPISKGGSHSIGNLVPACAPCNLSKRNFFLIQWKARQRK